MILYAPLLTNLLFERKNEAATPDSPAGFTLTCFISSSAIP